MEESRRLPIKVFSGKREDWHPWSRQYLARAQLLGYHDLITAELDGEKYATVDVKSLSDDELKLYHLNQYAYCELMMSCTDPLSFASIDDARTKIGMLPIR